MENRKLLYSKGDVDRAGKVLCGISCPRITKGKAVEILENFRLIHIHPMNLFRQLLGYKIKNIDSKSLISQRLKRSPSIINKLKIQKNMSLSQMQDVSGIRVVLEKLEDVYRLSYDLKKSEKQAAFKSTIIKEQDYIKDPKKSGYRSLHLVFKYEKNVELQKQCRTEIQLRTKIQHAWATAVEVVGTYLKQPLKQSFGDEKWLDLFQFISDAFKSIEDKNIDIELFKIVINEIDKNNLVDVLNSFRVVTAIRKTKTGKYFLIFLDFHNKKLSVRSYTNAKLNSANKKYSELEKKYLEDKNIEVVLVSVDDIDNLKKLYPNYFLDTEEFLNYINIIRNLVKESEK